MNKTPEVTTLQHYSHQEGYMTEQCVIFASKERVKEVLKPYIYGNQYAVTYDAAIALLVEAGITVVPVIGFAADGFNSEVGDMKDWVEDAPGYHFDKRPIMDMKSIEDIVDNGIDWLSGEDNEDELEEDE